jgi:hypothetical protein
MLVVAAGVSSALHAIIFDHFQSEFIAAGKNDPQFKQNEIERYQKEITALRSDKKNIFRILVLRFYLRYLALQARGAGNPQTNLNPESYRSTHRIMIRLFSFLGPTTNRTLLIVFALAGRVDIFLWTVIIPLNAWLIVTLFLHRGVTRRYQLLSAEADG